MTRVRGLVAGRAMRALGMVALALVACSRPPAPATGAPHVRPLRLNYDHLRRLMRPLTVNGRAVQVVALYATAPEYRPTGSPARDGNEGIASVDDAARAAVVFLRAYEQTGDTAARRDAIGLLAFLGAMEQGDGEWLNFVDTSGRPNATIKSGLKGMTFWGARSVWALGEAVRVLGPATLDTLRLRTPLERSLARIAREVDAGRLLGGSVTATSEALLGVVALVRAEPARGHERLAGRMGDLLVRHARTGIHTLPLGSITDSAGATWHAWGARAVEALASAGAALGRDDFVRAARVEADGLWGQFTVLSGVPAEVHADGRVVRFPQIAYGTGSIVGGYLALADAAGDNRLARRAGEHAMWFTGANDARTAMYDAASGRTFDGIDGPSPVKVNRDAGAESTIEALLALQAVAANADAAFAMRDTAPRAAPITLTYWPAANPTEVALATRLVAQWNAENPGVQVRVQPLPAGRSSEEVLLAAIVARATPDVCSNVSSALLARLVRAGGVVRLDDRVATAARLAERTSPAMLAPLRLADGGIHAFPWKVNPELLMYNVALLRAAGVEPPRTQGELLAALRRLARDTDGDGRHDRWGLWANLKTTWYERFYDFYPLYLASSGGRTLVQGDSVVFENDAAVQALELLRVGFAERLLPRANFSEGRDPFASGTVAMKIIGPWFIPELERIKDAGMRYDVVPVPAAEGVVAGDRYAFADMRNIAVFSTTRYPDEAARFVAFLTSPEADRLLIEEASQLPFRRGLATDARFTRSLARWPTLATYAANVERTRDLDIDPDVVEIFDVISEAYEAGAVYGTVPVRQAVARAAAEARRIVRAR
jgi:multiple sugar transport system substrate-binding protein